MIPLYAGRGEPESPFCLLVANQYTSASLRSPCLIDQAINTSGSEFKQGTSARNYYSKVGMATGISCSIAGLGSEEALGAWGVFRG